MLWLIGFFATGTQDAGGLEPVWKRQTLQSLSTGQLSSCPSTWERARGRRHHQEFL